jgi:hypothetical protein
LDSRFVQILLILGAFFPALTAELISSGYSLNEAVTAAGTTAIVAAEVIRRLAGGGSGPTRDLTA